MSLLRFSVVLIAIAALQGCSNKTQNACVSSFAGNCVNCVDEGASISDIACCAHDSDICFKIDAKCERQPSGDCGWTKDADFASCMTTTTAQAGETCDQGCGRTCASGLSCEAEPSGSGGVSPFVCK